MSKKYLYGASTQGIQEFIFKTNKLQEIIGASEIVKSINDDFGKENNSVEIILNAAGNIKAIFDDKDKLQKHIKDFAKKIQQNAYGITISQAVVEYNENNIQQSINNLEINLKIQRNRPSIPLDLSIGIMELAPSTAKPLFKYSGNKLDKASSQKRDAYQNWFKNKRKEKPELDELKDISKFSNSKNKIAVIHIDGNGLGALIPKLKDDYNIKLSEFSKKLDIATKQAFDIAKKGKELREIILGGDDVTVIINANDALDFTKEFMKSFEEETSKIFENKKHKLTTCAGIAFTNHKYPFHYAVELAEELCGVAKKHSKAIDQNRAPSCLMFHNVHSSSFQSWDKYVSDELTIQNDKQTIQYDFGPYYLNEDKQPKIETLLDCVKEYSKDGSPISRLREWLSQLEKSDSYSENLLKRINKVTKSLEDGWNSKKISGLFLELNEHLSNEKLIVYKDEKNRSPIFDILQIKSVTDRKVCK